MQETKENKLNSLERIVKKVKIVNKWSMWIHTISSMLTAIHLDSKQHDLIADFSPFYQNNWARRHGE